VKRILAVFGLAGVMSATGGIAATGEPAQPCPVLKVSISEFPHSERLQLHPSPESHRTVFSGSDMIGNISRLRGIRIAVLWENRTGEPLRDVTVRLEYQQAKMQAVRTAEQQLHDVPIKGRWTNFDLNGGEYRDTEHVAAWRVSVLSGDRILGSKQSVMWSDR
jgi:hypothetical protein